MINIMLFLIAPGNRKFQLEWGHNNNFSRKNRSCQSIKCRYFANIVPTAF